jgi:hypothetical protein
MFKALQAVKKKLKIYYNKTYSFYRSIYIIRIILDLKKKLYHFNKPS